MYFVVFALFLAHFCSKRMKIFKKMAYIMFMLLFYGNFI